MPAKAAKTQLTTEMLLGVTPSRVKVRASEPAHFALRVFKGRRFAWAGSFIIVLLLLPDFPLPTGIVGDVSDEPTGPLGVCDSDPFMIQPYNRFHVTRSLIKIPGIDQNDATERSEIIGPRMTNSHDDGIGLGFVERASPYCQAGTSLWGIAPTSVSSVARWQNKPRPKPNPN
jgi:hypothetical protein